jgi:hypothetical protein
MIRWVLAATTMLAALWSGRAAATAVPAPQVISGRGVTYFDGRVRCPFAGVGARGDQASNRIALDDGETRATIERARRRIVIANTHVYPSKQVIADLTFLGTATTESGARVPIAVHLKIEKKKGKISTDLHPHWTTRGKLSDPELEPFEVVYSDGAAEQAVASGADLLRVATETKISYTLAGDLLEVKDNLEGRGPSLAAGGALADLSLGFGHADARRLATSADGDVQPAVAGDAAARSVPARPRSDSARRRRHRPRRPEEGRVAGVHVPRRPGARGVGRQGS